MAITGDKTKRWNETNYVQDAFFLDKYFIKNKEIILNQFAINKKLPNRKKDILNKVLTVALLNKMLEQIAEKFDFTMHIRYENLCREPEKTFSEAANFLSLEFDGKMKSFLKQTQQKTPESEKDNYSVFRDTKKQLSRPLKFLTNKEAEEAKKMLIDCGLYDYE